jgi:hypothetical protein
VGEKAPHHSIIPISGYTSVLSQPLTLGVCKEIKKQYDMKRSENQNRLDSLVYKKEYGSGQIHKKGGYE